MRPQKTTQYHRSPRAYWEGIGRMIIMVPSNAILTLLNENKHHNSIYLTDIGYYPKATSHIMYRDLGSPEHILFYCSSGKGWCNFQGIRYEVSANQYFLLPKNQPHSYGADAKTPWTIYWFMYKTIEISDKDILRHTIRFQAPKDIGSIYLFPDSFSKIATHLSNGCNQNNLTLANACFKILMISLTQKNKQTKVRVHGKELDKIIQLMKSKIDHKLTIDEMAKMINYSPSRLFSVFKSQTGYSPMEYFTHEKIKMACHLLLNSNKQVKDIASDIGYDDPYHFSRIFKNIIGKSPIKFRSGNSS